MLKFNTNDIKEKTTYVMPNFKNKDMKKKIGFGLLVISLLSMRCVFAQPDKDSSKVEGLKSFLKAKIDFSLQAGAEWEQKINKTSVITLFGGLIVGRAADEYGTDDPYIVVPDAYAEYRNYYNLNKRIINKKNTNNNSANFLFGRCEVFFPMKRGAGIQNYLGILFIQGWGAQRSLGKKINADFHVGVVEHIYFDSPPDGGFRYVKLQPNVQWSFSYLFRSI